MVVNGLWCELVLWKGGGGFCLGEWGSTTGAGARRSWLSGISRRSCWASLLERATLVAVVEGRWILHKLWLEAPQRSRLESPPLVSERVRRVTGRIGSIDIADIIAMQMLAASRLSFNGSRELGFLGFSFHFWLNRCSLVHYPFPSLSENILSARRPISINLLPHRSSPFRPPSLPRLSFSPILPLYCCIIFISWTFLVA